ncbi:MAG: hypothetical protein KBF33_15690, partial [Comamonas sp.]|nr:hypothetical protein [Comamonas sp.]
VAHTSSHIKSIYRTGPSSDGGRGIATAGFGEARPEIDLCNNAVLWPGLLGQAHTWRIVVYIPSFFAP